ncbi:hypothetical protein RhiirA5_434978 [Rhizophagus irregularis]|uniref:Uncharacterized protein n=1 Tax=Rhizophagus irregularis TaxID=588596 RepID=A0A2N0NP47_9GLOM|nr:hypothetical protein RhiirA5_434978 [Rhizophagus irregularis]
MPEANLPTRSKCWHPTLVSVHENIKQSCVEHGHGGHWNAPNYQVEDVIYIDMKECYPASIRGQGECSPWFKQFGHLTYHFVQVAVEGELPSNDITGFVQQFLSGMENILPVEMEKNVGRQKQTKGWLPKNWDISCAIIEKFTQGNKVKEKRLIHQVVIDEGKKIHGPDPNVIYWPKNRYWKSIKNITKSIAPSIHDPITRSRVSYLNGGGGSEKTTRAIQIFKDINMVVFTHTNALAKDFQNNRKVKAQTWHSFFRWN